MLCLFDLKKGTELIHLSDIYEISPCRVKRDKSSGLVFVELGELGLRDAVLVCDNVRDTVSVIGDDIVGYMIPDEFALKVLQWVQA